MDAPLLLLTVGLLLLVVPFVLFVVALVDILRRESMPTPDKALWVVVVLVLPFVGAIVWFALRSRYGETSATSR